MLYLTYHLFLNVCLFHEQFYTKSIMHVSAILPLLIVLPCLNIYTYIHYNDLTRYSVMYIEHKITDLYFHAMLGIV